jgi:CheY-like chemotaxis protein
MPLSPARTPAVTADPPQSLLALVEFMEHGRLSALYERLGYRVTTEWSVRKAVPLLRRLAPDVLVADFYFQADFRDRVSNLESLLAAAAPLAGLRVLVLYKPEDAHALERVRQRARIDAALPLPVAEAELEAVLRRWASDPPTRGDQT